MQWLMAGMEKAVTTSFMSSSPGLLNAAYREHVMLMYHTDEERNAATVDYINEGLKKDHLCVYASVGMYDSTSKWNYSNLSSKVEDFSENIKQGSLVIMDSKPLFEAAGKRDVGLFNKLKAQLEVMIELRNADGKGDKLLVFADAACILLENNEFEGCLKLEGWWQSAHEEWVANHQNITVICPHSVAVFDEDTTTVHAKAQISALHSVVLKTRNDRHEMATVAKPIRVLIAEPEEDIQIVYRVLLDSLGWEAIIVPDAAKCFESVFNTKDSRSFDMIILDTHLKDIPGIVVAKQIKQRFPDQRIIITTTTMSAGEIERVGISQDDILYKPFSSSKLLGLIKPT